MPLLVQSLNNASPIGATRILSVDAVVMKSLPLYRCRPLGPKVALQRAHRACTAIAAQPVKPASCDRTLPISVSIGAPLGGNGDSPDRLMGSADNALNRAKPAGRNRTRVSPEASARHQSE